MGQGGWSDIESGSPAVDTDLDGLPDNIDDDDDDDGILDAVDAQPLVASIIAGFPNAYPGSLLLDPCVAKALDEYARERLQNPSLPEIVLRREHALPDLTGYYRSPPGSGRFITGPSAGAPLVGTEMRMLDRLRCL
jgi:hypothetical protein